MYLRTRSISFSLLVLAAVPALLANRPAAAQTPEFRAFAVDLWHAGLNSTNEIDSMISRAKQGRYNAIYAQVLGYHDKSESIGGAYWNSDVLPRHFSGFDPLAYLCQQAHLAGNNLEVHAWLIPYRVGGAWPPSTSGNPTLHNHPEWFMATYPGGGGASLILGDYYLDPGSPDVQEYIISIVRELVTRYSIDGIHWDYIRHMQDDTGYPAYSWYTKSGLARFYQITPIENQCAQPPPYSGCDTWDNFRRRGITELVRRTRAETAAIASPRQPLRHTGSLFTTGGCPANFTSTNAYAHKFSNWEEWMRLGYLDAGCPMLYYREHCPTQAQWYRDWVNGILGWRYQRHMYPTQGAYLNGMSNSVTQLLYARTQGTNGLGTYSYVATRATETLCDDNDAWTTDWSWYTSVADQVFTWEAPRPTMPWRDPATAAEGTIWGRVTNDAGQPADNASVGIPRSTTWYCMTDGNGYYVLTLVTAPAGGKSYSVTAYKSGVGTDAKSVMVYRAGLSRQDFVVSYKPQVSITADKTTVNPGQSVHFTPTVTYSSGASGASYVWHFGTDTVTGSGGPTAIDRQFNTVGDFDCYLTVTDTAGYTGESNHVTIHVEAAPCQPEVSITATPTAIDQGQNVRFTPSVTYENGSTGASYIWHFGTDTVTGSGAPTAIDRQFNAAGDFDCHLEVTDTASCVGVSNHVSIHVDAVVYAYGDFDHDDDVDLSDFAFFQSCFNGPNRTPPDPTGCAPADSDRDGDVDLSDFGAFQYCFNGPNVPPAQSSCYL